MRSRLGKYLFLPLFLILCGLGHVTIHMTGSDFASNDLTTSISSTASQNKSYYSSDYHHKKRESSGYEIVEQTQNSFSKDWIDDIPFQVFGLKNYTNSLFNLLSRRLSLNKPFLVQQSGEAIYKAIRVFRL